MRNEKVEESNVKKAYWRIVEANTQLLDENKYLKERVDNWLEEVKKIKCPTILVWGTMDQEVPIERAYELEELISDAAVIPYEGCSHYAYLERKAQTINIIKNFIGGNE